MRWKRGSLGTNGIHPVATSILRGIGDISRISEYRVCSNSTRVLGLRLSLSEGITVVRVAASGRCLRSILRILIRRSDVHLGEVLVSLHSTGILDQLLCVLFTRQDNLGQSHARGVRLSNRHSVDSDREGGNTREFSQGDNLVVIAVYLLERG